MKGHCAVRVALALALCIACRKPVGSEPDGDTGGRLSVISDARFAAGQVWTYRTRPGEEASRVIVRRIEQLDSAEVIVHIQIVGLKIRNVDVPSGEQREIGHAPISREALAASVVELVDTDRSPSREFEDGYEIWRSELDEHGGGYFTVPVARVVDLVQSVLDSTEERAD